MIAITLLDGRKQNFSSSLSVQKAVEAIDTELARQMVAAKVNDQLVDTSYELINDATLEVLTGGESLGLDIIRHSATHLLAQAVKRLFPGVKLAIGPVIEDGFYYDFAYERTFTEEDLKKIEKEMRIVAKENFKVERKILTKTEAEALFSKLNETYKLEIIDALSKEEPLTIYQQGEFIDLCRGPHVPRTGMLKAFCLTKVSGAYWKGDSKNAMLQRIYGTAWPTKQALSDYLKRLEEAEKRDHRLAGKKMSLFHFQPEAPGSVFWHPNGWTMVRIIRDYVRQFVAQHGYEEINTPQLVEASLWEKSGHLEKFSRDIFLFPCDNHHYAIKPMSCPCHVQIFKQGVTSYRDLPIRYAEFGSCHRNEPSGTLHGLMRLRAFTQDDAHIFCTEEQIQPEVTAFIDQVQKVYERFGFKEVVYKLSTRPKERVGEDTSWDKSEKALAEALIAKGLKWITAPGEGAFYGPKIEFSLRDCLGRLWQCGTIQVDYSMPARLEASFVDSQGVKRPPVMLHRAMFGSLERFLGILLEHYTELPLWLAPLQMVVMTITDRQENYAMKMVETFQKQGIRVKVDLRNEKIGFKIREHTIARVPYQVIIGDQEMAGETLAVRRLKDAKTISLTLHEFLSQWHKALGEIN